MKFTSEVSNKIRTAIKVKLVELGNDVYEELPDYIMVMVANRRSEEQMTDDLSLFLGDNTEQFTSWLHRLISKLQSVASVSSAEKPASASSENYGGQVAIQAKSARVPKAAPNPSDSESEHSDQDASCAMPGSNGTSKSMSLTDESHSQENGDSRKKDLEKPSQKESSPVNDTDSTVKTHDQTNLNHESSNKDNVKPEKRVLKRKMGSGTRMYRLKAKRLDSESETSNTTVAESETSNTVVAESETSKNVAYDNVEPSNTVADLSSSNQTVSEHEIDRQTDRERELKPVESDATEHKIDTNNDSSLGAEKLDLPVSQERDINTDSDTGESEAETKPALKSDTSEHDVGIVSADKAQLSVTLTDNDNSKEKIENNQESVEEQETPEEK